MKKGAKMTRHLSISGKVSEKRRQKTCKKAGKWINADRYLRKIIRRENVRVAIDQSISDKGQTTRGCLE